MIVELAQVVVPLIVHSWKDAAAGQLWQILDGDIKKKIVSGTILRAIKCFYMNKMI